MKIYRFEDIDGCGPYNSGCLSDKVSKLLNDKHNSSEEQSSHPSMQDDLICDVYSWGTLIIDEIEYSVSDIYSACDSLSSLLNWFDDWVETLLKEGLKIFSYEVDEIFKSKSGKQIFFLHDFDLTKEEVVL